MAIPGQVAPTDTFKSWREKTNKMIDSYADITVNTTNPTISDGSNAGYRVGSTWIQTVTEQLFTCVDASPGIAEWVTQDLPPQQGKDTFYLQTDGDETSWQKVVGSGVLGGLTADDIGVTVEAFDDTILKEDDIGVTVEAYNPAILKEEDIGGILSAGYLVATPTITSPTSGAIDFDGQITASAFATIDSVYDGVHDSSEWQLSYTSDFAVIEKESTVGNLTTWTPDVGASSQECFVRVRYGSDSHRSGNSETISFTTPLIFIEQPTLTVTGAPSDINPKPLLSTTAFSVNGGADTHVSTDWRITRDSVVVFDSLANTVDFLSISVPDGVLEESTDYTFEARHNGASFGNSAFASVEGTTVPVFGFANYLAVAQDSSPFLTIYGNDVDTSTKLDDPVGGMPAGYSYDVAFSADGNYMTVAHNSSPYISIYKRNGDVFTKLANPATLPTGTAEGVAFSADGTYMAVAHNGFPYITIYKRSGDIFTKLDDPIGSPDSSGKGVAFSPDGTYMAVSSASAPNLSVYIRNGDVFTKLLDPATLPAGAGHGVAFSQDGIHLAFAHSDFPFISIYTRSGNTFTKLDDPATLPAGSGIQVAFSLDGVHMAVSSASSPFLDIYKRDGDVFTRIADPVGGLPTGDGMGVAFSADGTYMAVAHNSSPFITRYKRDGDVFTKLADPVGGLPTGDGQAVAYYPGAIYP